MTNVIKQQVTVAIKTSWQFSLQVDGMSDMSDDAQLTAYVCYPGLTDVENNFCSVFFFIASSIGEA
jgi:hypothetical protein